MRDIKKIRLNEVRVVFDSTNKKEYHYTNVGGYKEEYELGDFLVDFLNYDNLFDNERLRKIVDFCFNFDNIEKLNNLTPFQRYCIYMHSRDIDVNERDLIKDIKIKLDLNLNFDLDVGKIKERTIFAIVEREISTVNHFISYSFTDFEGYCFMSLLHIFNTNITIKKCKNCGIYFIPIWRKDEAYCCLCKGEGANAQWKESLELYDWKKLHRQIYQSKQMKARRYPDIDKYRRDFKVFQEAYKEKKKDFKDNKITEEELIEWLNQQKK